MPCVEIEREILREKFALHDIDQNFGAASAAMPLLDETNDALKMFVNQYCKERTDR